MPWEAKTNAVNVGTTSVSLLLRVKSNDQDSWDRLVFVYAPLIYHWCRRAHLQPADAADVGQEVFRAVARAIKTYRHDQPGDSFRGWLRTITRNKIRDFINRCAQEPRADGGSQALQALWRIPDASQIVTDSGVISSGGVETERQILFQRALQVIQGEFEITTWQAFVGVVVDENSPTEVAGNLGISANAVYLAKSRVLKRLRVEFCNLVDF